MIKTHDVLPPLDCTLHQLFERQVLLTPDKIALSFQNVKLTYRELNEKSNQLAHYLKNKFQIGRSADEIVVLCLDRSAEMVISILAILKAGASYVPLISNKLSDRFQYILSDVQSHLLITQHEPLQQIKTVIDQFPNLNTIALDDETIQNEINQYPTSNLSHTGNPRNLAYVLYTSGTTGKPKGVMLEHVSITNRILEMIQISKIDSQDKYIFKTSYVFDVSVSDIFAHLLVGAEIVITKSEFDLAELSVLLQDSAITSIHLVPSQYHTIAPFLIKSSIQKIYFSGESLNSTIVEALKDRMIVNYYGPTETGEVTSYIPRMPDEAQIIGSAFANTELYVLDENLQLTEKGELYVGGLCLARGYLNLSDLTNARFIANPFKENEKLYKTGDLVKQLANGNIEYIGRNDFQIKLRGYRVELGEIEHALISCEKIKNAAVLVKERLTGLNKIKYLVAYYVADEVVEHKILLSQLQTKLPDYMLPELLIALPHFPLTSNGKLDRSQLPEPNPSLLKSNYVPPQNDSHTKACEIWQKILGLKLIGITDDFFKLGGNSLLAMQAAYQISQVWNCAISAVDIFEYKTIADLWLKCQHEKINHITILNAKSILSFAQERLWFIEQYENGTNAYHIPILLKLNKSADLKALKDSLNDLIQRHDILRTLIVEDKESGVAFPSIVDRGLNFENRIYSTEQDLQRQLRNDVSALFNLRTEIPMRAYLYQNAQDNMVLINIHHIAFDGWSFDIFIRELSTYYEYHSFNKSLELPQHEINYHDFARWQRDYLRGEVFNQQVNYWLNKLKDYMPLQLPIDKVRPTKINYHGKTISFILDEELSAQLKQLSQAKGTTLYVVMLTVFNILLSKYTGQQDIILGTPVANRHYPQIENVIGFFVNSLVLRSQIYKDWSINEAITYTHQNLIEAQHYQELPFEKLVEALKQTPDNTRHPIFQVMFGIESFDFNQEKLPFTLQETHHLYDVAKFDLSLFVNDSQKQLTGYVNYATSLFEQETIQRLIQHYIFLLQQIVRTPEQNIQTLSLLTSEEFKLLINQYATPIPYPSSETIVKAFETQAEKNPNNIALVFQTKELTYRELSQKSNQLAHYLRSVSNNDLIAIFMDRSLEMLIAIIAVLKAGSAYVPIDPNNPSERINYIINDSRTPLVLTQQHLARKLSHSKLIDINQFNYAEYPDVNLDHDRTGHDLAYVIYTSGTTGNPKGVLQTHGNVIRLFSATQDYYQFSDKDIWTLFHSYAFDFSVWEIWGALLYGGKLIIPDKSDIQDFTHFYRLCKTYSISILNQTPTAFYQFIQTATHRLENLRFVIFGGEALNIRQIKPWWDKFGCAQPKLVNMYGITETTVHVTLKELHLHDSSNSIGKPLKDLKAYVLDSKLVPVPIGVTGELYIGGAGLAREYLNRPELTRERFIQNPFIPSERIYKTGDLVRWLNNGELEYIGRNDFQVKIHGFRIELGEIEKALANHDAIQQNFVMVKEREGNKYLVAYYAAKDVLNNDALMQYLSLSLPHYMIPKIYIHLDQIPLTINGKLNINALPSHELTSESENYVAPGSENELALTEIWQLLLGVAKVGVTDDFFKLGGNSILAMQAAHQMSRKLNYQIEVASLFRLRTIANILAQQTRNNIHIAKQNRNRAPLSFAQERLWFIEQYEEGTHAYHIPLLFELNATVDIELFKQSLYQIVERHEVLRTILVADPNGGYQKILPNQFKIQEKYTPLEFLTEELTQYIKIPFLLNLQPPIRSTIYHVDGQRYALILIHHIAFDGWSTALFCKELVLIYQNQANDLLPALEIQYQDFAGWQRDYLKDQVLDRQIRYWKNKLANFEILRLPIDKIRPLKIDYTGKDHLFSLDADLSFKLRSLAKARKTTLYTVLLAAFYILLHKYTEQSDIVIGTPIANRHYQQVENLIGFFVNSLALRLKINSEKSYLELIKETESTLTEAHEYQDLTFEKLVEALKIEKDLTRHPVFQVMFSVQNFAPDLQDFKFLPVYDYYQIAKFDLSVFIDDGQDNLYGTFNYATSLFEPETIQQFVTHYQNILQQLVEQPEQSIKNLSVLTAAEYQTLIFDWNNTQFDFPNLCMHELFEAQVIKTPQNIAVEFEGETLTYHELNIRSNQLANYIRAWYTDTLKSAITTDTLIVLCLDRSLEMLVSILGVLKAGGAYVPVDPHHPPERIQYILNDTKAALALTQRHLADKVSTLNVIELDKQDFKSYSTQNPSSINEPTDLAYVIYTSGTTGKPKGVAIPHRGAVNRIHWMQQKYGLTAQDRILQKTSYAFDVSVWELFWAIWYGGSVVFAKPEGQKDNEYLLNLIQQSKISILHFVPSMFAAFLSSLQEKQFFPDSLRYIFCSGEVLSISLVRLFKKLNQTHHAELHNLYGPTEASIDVTYYDCNTFDNVCIGKPIHNTQLYILDKQLNPVPIGVTGELYIGGIGLARGYLNRDELTRDRFIVNPFIPDSRLYKTGDLARWLADGNVEYLGRNDFQVKIRGFRIELGEIENVLSAHPEIHQSVVIVKQNSNSPQLIGYYVADNEINSESLLSHLRLKLPDYMIPQTLMHLPLLPLTVNGKLDRQALPDVNFSEVTSFIVPVNSIEDNLCQIWAEVLGLSRDRVGVNDDFFKLGGDSILAIRLVSKINHYFNSDIKVRDIFDCRQINKLVERVQIGQSQIDVYLPFSLINKDDYQNELDFNLIEDIFPASLLQVGMLLESSLNSKGTYHDVFRYQINAPFNLAKLNQVWDQLIHKNPLLRAAFITNNDNGWSLVIYKSINLNYAYCVDQDVTQLIQQEKSDSFDFAKPGLFKVIINDLGNRFDFIFSFHHAITDGWSVASLMNEFVQAYLNNQFQLSYAEFIRNELKAIKDETIINFWREYLHDFVSMQNNWKFDAAKSESSLYTANFSVFEDQSKTLQAMARNLNISVDSIFLFAYFQTLAFFTGNRDLTIGLVVNNRLEKMGGDQLFGLFLNTVPFRLNLDKLNHQHPFTDVFENKVNLQNYKQLPYAYLKSQLKRDFYQCAFNFVHFHVLDSSSASITEFSGFERTNIPFVLNISQIGNMKFDVHIDAHDDYISKDYLNYFMEYYRICLINLMRDAESQLKLTETDANVLLAKWNHGENTAIEHRTLTQIFEEKVVEYPDHIAISLQKEVLTYAALNVRANQLAHGILKYWEHSENRLIAICCDRSLEMVIAILAVLKTGAAYVPIDPHYPTERIQFILGDTQTPFVLTQSHLAEKLSHNNLILLDEISYADQPQANLNLSVNANDMAYVIYTSGTTGQPKGVLIPHAGAVNTINAQIHNLLITPQSSILQFASCGFDAAVWEIFGALLSGAKLVLAKAEQLTPGDALAQTLHLENISIVTLPPVALGVTSCSDYSALKTVVAAGEACPLSVVQNWGLRYRFINAYGPTEASICTTFWQYDSALGHHAPIGKPIANSRVYVLNKNLKPVPIGTEGELYIGGVGLAYGYLKRDDLTRDRFITDPWNPESKLYKTGDLVRWLPDGNLEYVGRNDQQVKIRGYRIELGEIENALIHYPGISQTAVVLKNRDATRYLVAYYVAKEIIPVKDLNHYLQQSLPDYMIPSAFVHLNKLPVTINGKLDIKALPEAEFTDQDNYVAPRNELEVRIALVWQGLLGLKKVGVQEDFFRVGGDSILSIQMIARLRKQGLFYSVKDIFEHRTIERLAQHNPETLEITAEIGQLQGTFDLLPIQQWFFAQSFGRPNHWNQSFLIHVPKTLNIEKLKQIVNKLVDQHDILRLTFTLEKETILQTYNANIKLPEIIAFSCEGLSAKALNHKLTEWQSHFDIFDGPLWQINYLYGFEDGSSRIYLAFHHLIIDTVSWRILLEDIQALYEDKALPAKTSSYRQWVNTVNKYKMSEAEYTYWQHQIAGQIDYSQSFEVTSEHYFIEMGLSREESQQLLQQANSAYNTEINHLLLIALAYALKSWHHSDTSFITLEGHGREELQANIDTGRTIGWFTIMYPIKLQLRSDLASSIKSIKENLRQLIHSGLGFNTVFSSHTLPKICFNYLGQFNNENGNNWKISEENGGIDFHPDNIDHNILSINGILINGELRFSIISRLQVAQTKAFAEAYKKSLLELIQHCLTTETAQFTPSDFPTVKISNNLLDRLQNKYLIEALYPANSLQQGFIYQNLKNPQDDAYRVQIVLDYQQALDPNKFRQAWEHAIDMYPVLRTCFNWEEDLVQVVSKQGRLIWFEHDISLSKDKVTAVQEIQQKDRREPFDLTQPTLMRIHLIKQDEDLYTLLINQHHSIMDGWSGPVLLEEVHAYYLNQRHLVYPEQTYLQTQQYIATHQAEVELFWRQKLNHVISPNNINSLLDANLSVDQLRAIVNNQSQSIVIAYSDYQHLKEIAQQEGLTLNVLLQFAWHKLIHAYTGDSQTIVGTTISGRNIPISGIEESVGLYINTLPLIINWENNSIRDQLKQIQQSLTELNSHSFVNLSGLQKSGQRIFNSLLVFENYPAAGPDKITLTFTYRDFIEKLDYPLSLMAYETPNGLQIQLKYDGDSLFQDKALKLLSQLRMTLLQIPQRINQSHQTINLLPTEEFELVVKTWNNTQFQFPYEKTLIELWEEQVDKTPNALAVKFNRQSLTYNQLNVKANQLAHYIRDWYLQNLSQPFTADNLIALCLDRSLEMMVAILGVLKAGGAYVPIDPNLPQDRVNHILNDTRAKLGITQQHLTHKLSGLHLIDIAEDVNQINEVHNPLKINTSSDLAYVIYTSGTTGLPKGVCIPHQGVVNRIHWMQHQYPLKASDCVLQKTPYNFDVSVWEFLWAILYGGAVVFAQPDKHKDNQYLFDLIQAENISILHFVPSMLTPFLEIVETNGLIPSSLRYIFCSGEALSTSQVRHFKELSKNHAQLHNLYGPTEVSIDVTYFDCNITDEVYIGKPIHNTQLYILNNHLCPVSVGMVGELYIGGVGLAHGYLNQPELTRERFIDNPFETGARLYKTGDLARWCKDGNIEYLGRNDFQVKINGLRIELGEIENVLTAFSDIKQSIVIARRSEAKAQHILAYYMSDFAINENKIFEFLRTKLPEYMIPHAIIHLESFPLTVNGKLDRNALPNPEFISHADDYVAPRTDLEHTLCEVWENLLKIERVGINDDFFKLGGNSILAIQATHRMSKLLQKTINIADLLEAKTILKIVTLSYSNQQTIQIEKHDTLMAPLSFAQERLWFIEKYEQGTNAYHIPYIFSCAGDINISALIQSLQAIVRRHEILRTVIKVNDIGEYDQTILSHDLKIDVIQLIQEDLHVRIQQDISAIFDLENQYPVKAWIYVQENQFNLVLNFHHIAFDGWSFNIFVKELEQYYCHFSENIKLDISPLAIQYKDYAIWQRGEIFHEKLAQQISYWTQKLLNYAPLAFPADKVRPRQFDYRGNNLSFELDEELSAQVKQLAKNMGTTIYTVLLSAFYLLLNKYTGQDDIVIGTPIANRQYSQLENLIGFFVNSLVLRAKIRSHSFQQLIQQTHEELIDAQKYQDLPFEKLVDALGHHADKSQHPIFQIMFGIENFDENTTNLPLVRQYYDKINSVAKFDLSFFMIDGDINITGYCNYATSLYSQSTIERFIQHYICLLQQLIQRPDLNIDHIQLSTEKDLHLLLDWNSTDTPLRNKTLIDLFHEQVEISPNNFAVSFKDKSLTYLELNQQANQLARHIQTTQKIECGDLVAIFLNRSLEMIIAIIAIMKTGAAYIPIDTNYPSDRINYILQDSEVKLVLTQSHHQEKLPVIDSIVLDEAVYSIFPTDNLDFNASPENLAYIIYTSGTTGKPKGVLIPHASIVNTILAMIDSFSINMHSKVLQFASCSFDASVAEIFTTLLSGGKLVLCESEQIVPGDALAEILELEKITEVILPPIALSVTPCINYSALKTIISAGEACPLRIAATWGAKYRFINGYGPTEASICATAWVYDQRAENTFAPIGKPIANAKTYVLDQNLNPVPIGVVGELYIGGVGLARGYLKRDDLTAERFIINPKVSGERLYKTGDLARWLSDGNLEYIGRNDFQVKIRGFRIELGEIENTLSKHPLIKQSAVLVQEKNNNKYLSAYYVSETALSHSELESHLKLTLPTFMLPQVYMHLSALPLTLNGKLDRHALPEPDFNNEDNYVVPRSELEKIICQVWQALLGLEKIGIQDDFFRIGGDSILSIQLTARLRKQGLFYTVKDIFEYRTIERLAHNLQNTQNTINAEQGVLQGKFDLLPIQQWFFEQDLPNSAHWNQSFLIKVPELDISQLQLAIKKLVMQHDILRLQFDDDQRSQSYHPNLIVPEIKQLNCSDLTSKQLHSLFTAWQSHFNLAQAPLWQIGYINGYKDGTARLYFALHHLIVDTISWRIIIEDIKSLYEDTPIATKSSSYRQWVNTVKAYHADEDELNFWYQQIKHQPEYIKHTDVTHYMDIQFTSEQTKALLNQANLAFNTDINHLLLTALAYALKSWHQSDLSYITLEGHGREMLQEDIDLSRTLGWFTIMYPIKLQIKENLTNSIKSIKENVRQLIHNGLGYGALKYYGSDSVIKNHILPKISFNYLGQFNAADELWQIADEYSGQVSAVKNRDDDVISINGLVIKDELRFHVASKLDIQNTQLFAETLKKSLIEIIELCVQHESEYTPSDFKSINITQNLLDSLQQKYSIEAIYPANSLQQGFIYQFLTSPDDDAYRVQLLLDYQNPINAYEFKCAWENAIVTFPALRTCFNWDAELIQITVKDAQLSWFEHDISLQDDKSAALREIQLQDRAQSFDLKQPGLIRLHLIKQAENLFTLLISQHHSIMDGWSGPILLQHVHNHYTHGTERAKEHAYLDAQQYYASHQTQVLNFWNEKLNRMVPNDLNSLLSITVDLDQISSIKDNKKQSIVISNEVYHRLKDIAREHGLTLNVLVQFAWHKLIYTYTQDSQTIVGTTVSGRNLPINGIEESVGLYINTLPLIVDWNAKTIQEQLQQIHAGITELNNNCYVNLANLSKGKRLFHSIFAFENYPVANEISAELHPIFRESVEKIDYALGLMVYELNDQLHINLKYAGEYLTDAKAQRLLAQMDLILSGLIDKMNSSHHEINLLNQADYDLILNQWNTVEANYPQRTLIELFEEQVLKTPDQIAISYQGLTLTYQTLNQKSNQLAHYIRNNLVINSDTLIAISMQRRPEMIIGMLGILKAGAGYIPIDPNYPDDRIQYILQDAKVQWLLTDNVSCDKFSNINCLMLDDFNYEQLNFNNINLTDRNEIAYVIYTSGTTGKPKGVLVPHVSIVNTLCAQKDYLSTSTKDRILQFASCSFDASVWEIFGALLSGASLVLCSQEQLIPGETLAETLHNENISIVTLPPVVLTVLPYKKYTYLHTIILAGEAAPINTLQEWGQLYRCINAYGPTEASICASMWTYEASSNYVSTPIGKPLANVQLYVLDAYLNAVPIEVVGELYIGGAGLARGYLNRVDLTQERFVENPFAEDTKLYRTGDLVRWLPDGNLEYLGRNDLQVKIRGYRIELAEIENILLSYPGIQQGAVLAKGSHENSYLIAYYVAENEIDKTILMKYLTEKLPEYMIPNQFMQLSHLPVTINGKIDRGLLPEPQFNRGGIFPRNATELKIASIWKSLLDLEKISIHDDFFQLGGNSILSIQLIAKLRDVDILFSVKDIFTCRTIEKLAQQIRTETDEPITIINSEANSVPLIILPPAEGGVESYLGTLCPQLSHAIKIVLIDNELIKNHSSYQFKSYRELAIYYVNMIMDRQIVTDRCYLAGWSIGAIIAYEMMLELERRNIKVLDNFLFDPVVPALLELNISSFEKLDPEQNYLPEKCHSKISVFRCVRYDDTFPWAQKITQTPVLGFNKVTPYWDEYLLDSTHNQIFSDVTSIRKVVQVIENRINENLSAEQPTTTSICG